MSTQFPTRLPKPTPTRVAALTLCLMLGGCSVISNWWGAEKTDYHGQAKRTQPLEVPPDLTQLQRDSRYLPQSGVITASDMAHGASAPAGALPGAASASAPATPSVALSRVGDAHLVRQGDQRWIATTEAPEVVWSKVRDFWTAQGFSFKVDDPKTGILETDWKMNPATLPRDFVHEQLGRVFDAVLDSGLRDRYRTRLERQPDGGTEIFVTQYGATEEIVGFQKSETQWVPRPNDPGLEAQMMSQMLLSLGGVTDTNLAVQEPESPASPASAPSGGAQVATAAGTGLNGAARAHVIANQPGATLQVDDNFDRSWRRIGLALDHGGFTVEDRDRAQGLYYVRFVDAKEAAKDEPGILTKFKGWFGKSSPSPVGKYRLSIKSTGDVSTATVLNDQGQPDNSDNAKRMVALLVDELK